MDLVRIFTAGKGKLGKKNMLFRSALVAVVSILIVLRLAVTSPVFAVDPPRRAHLILVLIVDGLRPDSINSEDTPNLYRLRQEGVNYLNAHAVFPTVTRVNSAAISTGTYPGTNGLVSNSMFVPEVHPAQPFNTGDFRQLLKLAEVSGGNLLFAKSLGERLHERGLRFVAVSSGSTGNALLSNHLAPQGVGILVNGNFEPGKRVAYPDSVNAVILSRFGAAPTKEDSALVDWTDNVLREYILPGLKPDVVIDWQTEPDTAQHSHGVGSQEAREALRNSDRNIGLTLKKLESLGLINQTDIIVVSDHGFSLNTYGVNVTQELIRAGLKSSTESDDVVVVSNGQSVLLHVKNRNPQHIGRIVRYLQEQNWTDVVFTPVRKPSAQAGQTSKKRHRSSQRANPLGWVVGTFSLEFIHEFNQKRGPDILFTLPWSSSPNTFGVSGTHYTTTNGMTGPLMGDGSGHGGMSPWVVRSTMIAWGVDFKRGVAVRVPASNVDIVPTILTLKGISVDNTLDGRVLSEALRDGVDEEQVSFGTRLIRTQIGTRYRAVIQVTEVGRHRYIDKSWRIH